MKLTVLVDNNTLIDRYFLAEPGLSFLRDRGGRTIDGLPICLKNTAEVTGAVVTCLEVGMQQNYAAFGCNFWRIHG